jgi:polysaccharide biosynthesis/export protein
MQRISKILGLSVACLLAFAASPVHAQTNRQLPSNNSDLARQNMSRVGASATEIKTVLVKDPGLMVELKRWVAKDATQHGQVLTEQDLTDDAIFDRLVSDVEFRAVATQLVQRYGYLVPQLNPDSVAGKEQDMLSKERAKLIAADEQESASKDRDKREARRRAEDFCEPQTYDPQLYQQCLDEQHDLDRQQYPAQFGPNESPQDQNNSPNQQYGPTQPNQQDQQRNNFGGQLQRASLGEEGLGGDMPDLPLGGADASTALLLGAGRSSLGFGSGGSSSSRSSDDGSDDRGSSSSPSFSMMSTSGSQSSGAVDSLSTFGVGAGRPTPSLSDLARLSERMESASSMDSGSGPNTGSRTSSSPYGMMMPNGRRYQPKQPPPAPELVRAANPYKNIPSLYDMYVQAIPRPLTPKRFGAEVFENGSRDSQLIPMDVPAGPDYVVGPGDGLSVNLWGSTSQRIYRVVDREGRVSLPEVGPVLVSGKSMAQVQEYLQQTLRTQYHDISADVSLSKLRTIRVYEVGDIANPGAYDISSLSTPLNALFVAGGPTQKGSMRIVKHFRGDQLVQEVDLYDLLLRGVRSNLLQLDNGDTVQVPPIGPQVTIDGMVRRPAVYELKDEKNLSSVLELAGGLLPTATLRHIEVQRLVAHQSQTMLSFDIPEGDGDAEVTKKMEAFEIHDGDRIRVFPIAPGNLDAVYLEGHVIRPGRYSYKPEMHVTDLIGSYKDLLPEPANQYAEIIRINAPDFHPSVESFDLSSALQNPSQSPVLKAMDTVRIFSRFDFENPPSVSVWGDVRGPGTYRTSGQIHVADAVHLAGGVTPEAQVDDAQVFRYLPDGKMKIFSVSLNLALEGDPNANILLEPRDRLLIHKSAAATQPSTVLVQGDVGKPGRYPLTTNMTVGDMIRIGGGLKPSADTQLADLTHFEWINGELNARHESVSISAALAGDASANLPISNGDVLTIRQLPQWNDLGSYITVKGEVGHPGTYGFRPGEKLSSVLERAGGFGSQAYPYGAVLMRRQVREIETNARLEMVRRLREEQINLKELPENDTDQKNAKLTAIAETEVTMQQLQANPPVGRVVIRIQSDIAKWRNTSADVPVSDGDVIVVPKKLDYITVNGQVFNPTAVSFRPGRSARWYLSQSGGLTQLANKKAIFVIRADGSVLAARNNSEFWEGDPLGSTLRPGDSVVVPEVAPRIGTRNFQNLFQAGQLAASAALAVAYIH